MQLGVLTNLRKRVYLKIQKEQDKLCMCRGLEIAVKGLTEDQSCP